MNPTPSLFGLPSSNSNGSVPPSVAHMFGPCRPPVATHGGRRHRRNTSSSIQSDSSCDYFEHEVLDEDSPEDEDNESFWAAPSSSGRHAYYSPRTVSGSKLDTVPYGTPASPSPARMQLQRAAKSSPSVPRRHSHSQSVSNVAAHPPSYIIGDGDHAVTPHEVVLRSRLECVLKNAKVQDRRPHSVERRDADSGFSSGSGNSMASSRNLSGEGDFFFGANADVSVRDRLPYRAVADPLSPPRQSSLTSLTSNDAKHRYSPNGPSPRPNTRTLQMAPHGSPRSTHKPLSSKKGSISSTGPLTPPPSPPFNARQAAAQCKAMNGYISFANIEGLGVPEGSDEEVDDEAKSRSRWFQWLHISGKAGVNDRARGRSDSSSASR